MNVSRWGTGRIGRHLLAAVVVIWIVAAAGCGGGGGSQGTQDRTVKPIPGEIALKSAKSELLAIRQDIETATERGLECEAKGDRSCLAYWKNNLREANMRISALKAKKEPSAFSREVEEGEEAYESLKQIGREGRQHEAEELRGRLAPSSARAKLIYQALNRGLSKIRAQLAGISPAARAEAIRRLCGSRSPRSCLGSPFVG